MISNVSFAGKLFATGNIPNLAKRGEMFQLKEAAKESDFDVVLLQRDYYSDGTGVYDALIVKTDKHTGKNLVEKKEIDFKKISNYKELKYLDLSPKFLPKTTSENF